MGACAILLAVIEANFLNNIETTWLVKQPLKILIFTNLIDLIIKFILEIPIFCLCAQRFNDMHLNQYRYLPAILIMTSGSIDSLCGIFLDWYPGIGINITIFIVLLCLVIPGNKHPKALTHSGE